MDDAEPEWKAGCREKQGQFIYGNQRESRKSKEVSRFDHGSGILIRAVLSSAEKKDKIRSIRSLKRKNNM